MNAMENYTLGLALVCCMVFDKLSTNLWMRHIIVAILGVYSLISKISSAWSAFSTETRGWEDVSNEERPFFQEKIWKD